MSFAEYKAMREEIRSFLGSRTYVSYPRLIQAAVDYFHCTRDEAEYAIRDLRFP